MALTGLQEHERGIKRGWLLTKGMEGDEMLLGVEIITRLTPKRSPIVARSVKLGLVAR